ncbi:MAG: hypothetical protein PQ612_06390 [Rickettsiales bacterium]|nr:hypothetical protein [Pseudomonadota bacterium]MDA0966600.1 hypothetical protein [Pseudomonadota bacterium]MDG4543629.1 hypothetical protein [Rickettsiales bacterium]MDG4545776.1 hypothetical protein [Rickettsiales bacterium]MDG4547451.1 hypothetical protein [Rickettsiales bacterium]
MNDFFKGFLLGFSAAFAFGYFVRGQNSINDNASAENDFKYNSYEEDFGTDAEMVAQDLNKSFSQYTKTYILNEQHQKDNRIH